MSWHLYLKAPKGFGGGKKLTGERFDSVCCWNTDVGPNTRLLMFLCLVFFDLSVKCSAQCSQQSLAPILFVRLVLVFSSTLLHKYFVKVTCGYLLSCFIFNPWKLALYSCVVYFIGDFKMDNLSLDLATLEVNRKSINILVTILNWDALPL